jgi:predicted PurR-regulated permease PerM
VIVRPFGEALFFAAVLAGVLYPLQERFSRLLKNRRSLSAGVLCFGVVVALVAPIGGIAAFAVTESINGARFIAKTVQSEGMTGLLDQLPSPVRKAADELLKRFPLEEQDLDSAIQQQASAQGGKAARAVTGALAATGSFLFQAIMMTIALFCLLVDGESLVRWLEQVSPLEDGQTTELLVEFRKVTGSVLISSLATSGVQALTALVGYLIASVPHPLFFTTITFFVSFIPAVGAGGMTLAAALLVFGMGKTWMAVFLAIWGLVAVGMVDNIIKPLLVKRGMHMHGAIVFFSLLGGLTVFGTVGLLAGPLIVSFFLATVRIYQRDYGQHPELVDATGRSASHAGTGGGPKLIV